MKRTQRRKRIIDDDRLRRAPRCAAQQNERGARVKQDNWCFPFFSTPAATSAPGRRFARVRARRWIAKCLVQPAFFDGQRVRAIEVAW
jgi:hypothetical protein